MVNFLLQLQNVSFSYNLGEKILPVLRDVNLRIREGEFVAIQGPSGAGKSTLLSLLAALEVPTRGKILFAGENLVQMSDTRRTNYRRQNVGIVFQAFHLISYLNVLENVELGLMFHHYSPQQRLQRARQCVEHVGLLERINHNIRELSGGEQQRVCIARAIVNTPKILLADEPTGNLDSQTASEILLLFKHLNEKLGVTVLMVTHDQQVADFAHRTIYLLDGQIASEEKQAFTRIKSNISLLKDFASGLSSVSQKKKIFNTIVEIFARSTGVDRVSLMLLDRRKNVLRIVAGVGIKEAEYRHTVLSLGEGVAGQAAQKREPVLIKDISSAGDYRDVSEDIQRPEESLLALPIVYQNEVLGVINLSNKLSGQPFDIPVLTRIVEEIAEPIYKLDLYENIARDETTGFFSRDYLLLRLEDEIEKCKNFGSTFTAIKVLLPDFNSEELKKFSGIVQQVTRATDYIGYLEAQTLLIVLPATSLENSAVICSRLKTRTNQELKLNSELLIKVIPWTESVLKVEEFLSRC